MPQQFPRVRVHANKRQGRHRDDHAKAPALHHNRRRIAGPFARARGFPNHLTRVFVQRNYRRLRPTRRANDIVPVNQQRFAQAPFDVFRIEFIEDIDLPIDAPCLGIQANDIANRAFMVDAVPIHRWRSPRTRMVLSPSRAILDLPQLIALHVKRSHDRVPIGIACGIHHAPRNRDRGVTMAQALGRPHQGRSAFRPRVEQAFSSGNVVAVRPVELRPKREFIRGPRRSGQHNAAHQNDHNTMGKPPK